MLAGEFSSRWIWYKIPYMCIIARASTKRVILFAFLLLGLIAAVGCGMEYDQDFRLGLATILKDVILEAENVRLEACDSFEGKDYLLFCPDYPWNRNNQKQLMTEEAVDELFRKYIPVLTDIPIEIDYQSVENGG